MGPTTDEICDCCGGKRHEGFAGVSLDGTATPLYWIAGGLEREGLTRGAVVAGRGAAAHRGTSLRVVRRRTTSRLDAECSGVDISADAIDLAARRYPDVAWVVANADRWLPYPDASFDLVASITARRNAPEFARVLREGGRLFIAEQRVAGLDRLDVTFAWDVMTFARSA